MEGLAKVGVTQMNNEIYDEKVFGGERNDTWLFFFVANVVQFSPMYS